MDIVEKKSAITSALISTVVGAAAALFVGVYSYMNQVNDTNKELRYVADIMQSQNYDLREQIEALNRKVHELESKVEQNNNLIKTFDTNLQFQSEVVKSLLNKKNNGGE